MCTAFKSASADLCQSLALLAKRLCTSLVPTNTLAPLLACRLIALDKSPGVRPIGIGRGQKSGCEIAIHSVGELFQQEETEAVLLVDASNAFNSLNRKTALHNISHICPSLVTILRNTYTVPRLTFSLRMNPFCPRKVLHRAIHSQCLSMPLPHCHSLRDCSP